MHLQGEGTGVGLVTCYCLGWPRIANMDSTICRQRRTSALSERPSLRKCANGYSRFTPKDLSATENGTVYSHGGVNTSHVAPVSHGRAYAATCGRGIVGSAIRAGWSCHPNSTNVGTLSTVAAVALTGPRISWSCATCATGRSGRTPPVRSTWSGSREPRILAATRAFPGVACVRRRTGHAVRGPMGFRKTR